MSSLTLTERSRLARLAADRTRRALVARALRSPLLSWRYGRPAAEELLLIPQELRTADPSFAEELAHGQLGLGDAVASIGTGSIFDVTAPSEAWSRALFGFGWLRNLTAAGTADDRAVAEAAIVNWIDRFPPKSASTAWHPDVIGRRLTSWLTNIPFVFESIDGPTYDKITDSLSLQIVQLATRWRDAPSGYPRLEALIGLLTASLCIAESDDNLPAFENGLIAEIRQQVLPDGGHISRNSEVVIDILLDLLPLRSCFNARERPFPPEIEKAMSRMLSYLRFMRLGDGTIARFNGVGATPFDSLATLLAYDPAPESELAGTPDSNYARLSAGPMILIADVGTPPPLEYAGAANAGALSFELSIAGDAVFVNAGTPGPANQDWLATARATASHNTACLNATSSAKLLRNKLLNQLVRAAPIRYPDVVTHTLFKEAERTGLRASHNGYERAFGVTHRRELSLSRDGRRLTGEDIIGGPDANMRFARDLPYAIHFHLDCTATCRHDDDPAAAIIQLCSGDAWRFQATGATLSIEDSISFTDLAGPTHTSQIVLRGASFGETRVNWSLERA